MISIAVPGLREYAISHLVIDLHGTIATGGQLLPGVEERLTSLREQLSLHVITTDRPAAVGCLRPLVDIEIVAIAPGRESDQKGRYVRTIGASTVAAIGSGGGDVDMLRSAAIGIAVLGPDGLATVAHQAADVLTRDITDALDLLLHPARLVETLRR